MDGYLNGIFDNEDYIASKEEINTSIQKLEDYKSKLEQTAKTPENTLTDRINILKKLYQISYIMMEKKYLMD